MSLQLRSPTLCEEKAVSGLLEEGQKKTIVQQQWHEHHFKGTPTNQPAHLDLSPKCESRKGYRISRKPSPQKDLEKERLKKLLNQRYRGMEPQPSANRFPRGSQEPHKSMKWGRLRPFDSQLTFYSQEKQMKMVSSSMNFYSRKNPEDPNVRKKSPQPLDAIKKNESKSPPKRDESSNVILFKPNRSETIRELLNHMGRERSRNKQIVLNSTQRPTDTPGYVQSTALQPQYLREYERKVMNQYKNFVPFREDDRLLLGKVIEQDNVWKKRFKESWSRKKKECDTRKSYFKALVVHD